MVTKKLKNFDAEKVFKYIKKTLADIREKNKTATWKMGQSVSIDTYLEGNWYGAKETYYRIRLYGGEEFRCENKYELRREMDKLRGLLNKLKETKGWGGLYYKEDEEITFVGVADAPCKEYKSLMNYLNKYGNAHLDNYRLFHSAMGGKRGVLWDDYGDRNYLDNNPKRCELFLSRLRANRGSKDKMTCRFGSENYIDDFERKHSQYYEVECEGEKRHYIEVTITTPSGKVKYEEKIF